MTQKRKRCDERFEITAARVVLSGEIRAIELARGQERMVSMLRTVSVSQAHHPVCSSRTPLMKF